MFHAAIHQHHPLLPAAVALHFAAADQRHLVFQVRVGEGRGNRKALRHDGAQLGAFVAEQLHQRAGVDAADAGNALFLQPLVEAFGRVPVAVFFTVVGNHESAHVDPFGFEARAQAFRIELLLGNAVVAHERKTHAKDLSAVGRVGQAFGIAHHGGGKDDFSLGRTFETEAPSREFAPVLQAQRGFFATHRLTRRPLSP